MWRSLCTFPRFKKIVTVALASILMACFFYSQSLWDQYRKIEITYFQSCQNSTLVECKPNGVMEDIVNFQNQEQEAESSSRKQNLVFIKTHKCGTSSIVNTFYLFGVRKRLNFVIQRSNHPHYLELKTYPDRTRPLLPPRPGTVYNIQCQHGTFRPDIEHIIMPKKTSLYSTIVRSPVSQFKSAFSFFGAERRMRQKYGAISMDELIGHYLDLNPAPTEYSAPFSNALNSVAADLGWLRFSSKMPGATLKEKIDAFVKHLDNEMDFVMITDRMDESLIILKEYLGWNMTDIVYLNRMVSSKPKVPMSEETKARILKYQVIDARIYDHFNASFQRHVEKIGREKVASQVKEFKEMREAFENKCFNKNKTVKGPYNSISWEISYYGQNKNMACTFLQTRDITLTRVVTQLQLSQDYTVPIGVTHGPYLMQHTVTKIQRDYDNNEDPV